MYKIVGTFCILAGCAGFGCARVRQEKTESDICADSYM